MTAVDEARRKSKKSLKKRLLSIGIPLVLLIVGLMALNFIVDFDKIFSKIIPKGSSDSPRITIAERFYMPLDDVLVSLQRRDGSSVFLSLSIILELERSADQDHILRILPNVQDSLQVFLREIDPDELRGAEGIYRLREELLFRINKIVSPVMLRDVLFKNIVLQ